MGKLLSILLLAMWSFYLLSRLAERITQWHQERQATTHNDEGDWEIIEPAESENGRKVQAQLSQREKARRVFGARVHTSPSLLEKRIARGGILTLGILIVLALLILVPTLIIALR